MTRGSQQLRSDVLGKGDFVYRDSEAPPIFHAGSGARLTDQDGHVYLDAEAANGTLGLGYDASILAEAAARASALPALPSFCESELRLKVAGRIAALVERHTGMRGRVSFELGGAQGIELALKIAAANRKGRTILTFEGAYHGRSDLTAQLSASARYRRDARSGSANVYRLPLPDCERCRFGQTRSSCRLECAAFARTSMASEFAGVNAPDHDGVYAAVMEPVLNVSGMVLPEPAYFTEVAAQARKAGALLIVDEVFSGLYRTGPLWGFQRYDVKPDLIVFSKGFTNGLVAMSGVWAREPLLAPENFAPGTHSITYGNNPLSLAVLDVVLDRYEREIEGTGRVASLEQGLRKLVTSIVEECPLALSASAHGATARIRLRRPLASRVRKIALSVGRERPVAGCTGLMVASTGLAQDVINLHPPLNLAESELPVIQQMLSEALRLADREGP